MKKLDPTSVFGIVGILSWTLTILLRETTVNSVETVNFKNFGDNIWINFFICNNV